jgi:Neocarzinostatin family
MRVMRAKKGVRLGACAGALVSAPAGALPIVFKVKPSTDLSNGQSVKVKASGIRLRKVVTVEECASNDVPVNLGRNTADEVQVKDIDRRFKIRLTVVQSFTSNTGNSVSCSSSSTDQYYVYAYVNTEDGPRAVGQADIEFAAPSS